MTPRREWCAALAILLVAGAAMWIGQRDKSPTIDEAEQIWAGYLALVHGDYSVNPHPPLTQLAQAAPLVAIDARLRDPKMVPLPRPGISDLTGGLCYLYYNTREWRTVLGVARGVSVLFTLMFLLAAWLAARRMYGAWRALWVLAMLAVLPNVHAWGRLATTEFATTAVGVLALLALGRFLEAPTKGGIAIAGVALGLGIGSKTSMIYLAGVAPLCVMLSPTVGDLRQRAIVALQLMLVAAATVAALFGFVHIGEYPRGLRINVGDRLHKPYWLRGALHHERYYGYLLVVLAVKFPHAHQLAALGALGSLRRRPTPAELPLIVAPLALLVGMLLTPINLGARHVTPGLCCLIILAGRVRLRWPTRRVAAVVLGLAVAAHAYAWPHMLTYFNAASGGPTQGHWWLIDTNLDIGQDLGGLDRWMREKQAPCVYLAYFGTADLSYYGSQFRYVPDLYNGYRAPGADFPTPTGTRYLAISVTLLHLDGPNIFEWLRKRTPVAKIGHTLWIYDVSDSAAAISLADTYRRGGHPRMAPPEEHRAMRLRREGR